RTPRDGRIDSVFPRRTRIAREKNVALGARAQTPKHGGETRMLPQRDESRTMSFGQHLRALREGAGLPRAALARRAGVPLSTLRRWEGDQGFPGLPALLV